MFYSHAQQKKAIGHLYQHLNQHFWLWMKSECLALRMPYVYWTSRKECWHFGSIIYIIMHLDSFKSRGMLPTPNSWYCHDCHEIKKKTRKNWNCIIFPFSLFSKVCLSLCSVTLTWHDRIQIFINTSKTLIIR